MTRIVTAVGVLLVLLLIGAGVTLKLRRRLLGGEDSAGDPLSLHDLRRMHAEGTMNDEEFEKAKAALIGVATIRPGTASGKGGQAVTPNPGVAPHKPQP